MASWRQIRDPETGLLQLVNLSRADVIFISRTEQGDYAIYARYSTGDTEVVEARMGISQAEGTLSDIHRQLATHG